MTMPFSHTPTDYFIFLIDVASTEKCLTKRGLGVETYNLLVLDKIDLAQAEL